jgi:hypothetical protein
MERFLLLWDELDDAVGVLRMQAPRLALLLLMTALFASLFLAVL